MKETVILDVKVDSSDAKKRLAELTKESLALKRERQELDKALKSGQKSEEEYAQALVDLNLRIKQNSNEQRSLNQDIELATKINNSAKNSYNQLSAEYIQAKKALNELAGSLELNEDGSVKLTEAYENQAKRVKQLKEAIISFDQGVKDGRTNVGNYKDALEQSGIAQIGFLGVIKNTVNELGNAAKGIIGAAQSLGVLKTAIAASGIGLIALLIAGLVQAFQNSQTAADKFTAAFAGIKQILNIVSKPLQFIVDLVGDLAESFVKGLSSLAEVLGLGDSIERAQELEAQLIALNRQQKQLEVTSKEIRAQEEEQKKIRDDESKSIEERLKANNKLAELEQKRVNLLKQNETARLAILEEQVKIKGKEKATDEELEKINESRLKIAELQEESLGIQTEQITNQVSLLREQAELENAISSARLENEILNGRIAKGSRQELEQRIALERAQLEISIKNLDENNKQRELLTLESNNRIKQLENEFNQAQVENFKAAVEKQKEINQARIESENRSELARLEFLKNITEENTQERVDAEKAIISKNEQISLQNTQLTENERNLIIQKANLERLKLQEDFEASKQAVIDQNNEKILEKERQALEKQRNQAIKDIELSILQIENRLRAETELTQAFFDAKRELAAQNAILELENLDQQLLNEQITRDLYNELRIQSDKNLSDELIAIKEAEFAARERLENETINLFSNTSAILKEFAGQNKEAQKAAFAFEQTVAIAQSIVNLQRAISGIIAANSNNPLGQILAAAQIAAATAQILGAINRIRQTKFNKGGFTGDGFGAPDETGFKPAGIVHEGEYVVPKRIVNNPTYQPAINFLENARTKGYAAGGIVTSSETDYNMLINAISNMKVSVSVEEISDVQNRVLIAEKRSTF